MSNPPRFLVCDSATHAELVDRLVMEHLRDTDAARGASWSGVYAKPGILSDTHGILWGAPVEGLFGDPAEDPSMEVVSGDNDWVLMPPPEPVESDV